MTSAFAPSGVQLCHLVMFLHLTYWPISKVTKITRSVTHQDKHFHQLKSAFTLTGNMCPYSSYQNTTCSCLNFQPPTSHKLLSMFDRRTERWDGGWGESGASSNDDVSKMGGEFSTHANNNDNLYGQYMKVRQPYKRSVKGAVQLALMMSSRLFNCLRRGIHPQVVNCQHSKLISCQFSLFFLAKHD